MPRAAAAQLPLFAPPPPPPSHEERARVRLRAWADELEAAADGSWEAERAAARLKLLADVASWLPPEEGGPLEARIAAGLRRVSAGR